MKQNKITLVLVVVLLVIVYFIITKFSSNGNGPLVNPGLGKPASQVTPTPEASSYNPPEQVQYNSSTDLKKELDSVNPQISDVDFQ